MSDQQCKPPVIIYLHGFNSSPLSFKARYLQEYLDKHGLASRYFVPDLHHSPEKARAQAEALILAYQADTDITLIGSSLGGYYATSLAEQYGLRAVLINPAVYPYRLLTDYLGINHNYHTGASYEMKPEHIDELLAMEARQLKEPLSYLVLLQTADETLDYREAEAKYCDTRLVVEQGGSHAFDHFDQRVPQILEFAGFETLN